MLMIPRELTGSVNPPIQNAIVKIMSQQCWKIASIYMYWKFEPWQISQYI